MRAGRERYFLRPYMLSDRSDYNLAATFFVAALSQLS